MFEKLLLAMDETEFSQRAAEAAIRLGQSLRKASVTILHVSGKTPTSAQARSADFDPRSLLDDGVRSALEGAERLFAQAGVTASVEVVIGSAAEEIVKHAERGGYDLILVGTRGLDAFNEMIFGSVSHRVAHEAGCPVMIVK